MYSVFTVKKLVNASFVFLILSVIIEITHQAPPPVTRTPKIPTKTRKETRHEFDTKANVKPGTALQNQLDSINLKLDYLYEEYTLLNARTTILEAIGLTSLPLFEKKINEMDKSVKHLEKVNQIWKSNFKTIKENIAQIRQRINYNN